MALITNDGTPYEEVIRRKFTESEGAKSTLKGEFTAS